MTMGVSWMRMLVLLPMLGCGAVEPDESRRTVYEILHHGIECGGEGLHMCLLARGPGEVEFTPLFPVPIGFDPRWGYRYTIEVVEVPTDDPPQDGSSVERHLRSVTSSEWVPAGTEFEVVLTGGASRVRRVGQSRFDIYGVAEFDCPARLQCEELAALLDTGGRVHFWLRLGAEGVAMDLVAWSEEQAVTP